jgi:cytochrome c553
MLAAVFTLWLATDDPGAVIVLGREGRQGAVAFDHAAHVKAPRDPSSPYPAPATASCGACHHTRDIKGVIQLAKCEGCHGPEGDARNPKGHTFDEENRKTAYHQMCVGCHENLAKAAVHSGPVDCVDCHKTNAGGGG